MLKYMLDTNIVIYILKRRPNYIYEKFSSNVDRLCISTITLAELMHGVEKSENSSKNRHAVEDFISRLEVLEYGKHAAYHFGDIRALLERRGTPIGVNDLHIAAHARSLGLAVVTNNLKEFERVPGLVSLNWIE